MIKILILTLLIISLTHAQPYTVEQILGVEPIDTTTTDSNDELATPLGYNTAVINNGQLISIGQWNSQDFSSVSSMYPLPTQYQSIPNNPSFFTIYDWCTSTTKMVKFFNLALYNNYLAYNHPLHCSALVGTNPLTTYPYPNNGPCPYSWATTSTPPATPTGVTGDTLFEVLLDSAQVGTVCHQWNPDPNPALCAPTCAPSFKPAYFIMDPNNQNTDQFGNQIGMMGGGTLISQTNPLGPDIQLNLIGVSPAQLQILATPPPGRTITEIYINKALGYLPWDRWVGNWGVDQAVTVSTPVGANQDPTGPSFQYQLIHMGFNYGSGTVQLPSVYHVYARDNIGSVAVKAFSV